MIASDDLAAHRAGLYERARHLGASHDVADDLVQEALLRLVERGHQLREPAMARAWLLTTLRRLYADRFRRSRRAPVELSLDDL